MFDQVAERYDLLNDVLSAGQDRRWRKAVARAAGAGPGDLVLDLAAGTGTSSRALAGAGARCVACDFSLGMLRAGASRAARAPRPGPDPAAVVFAAGDALALPFRDQAFDVVTMSFGLRNVADPSAALAELLRVSRPGGRLVICEFSHLPGGRLDACYEWYLARALPLIAGRLSRNPAAYAYLAESISDWPDQRRLAGQIMAAGWSAVRWRSLTFGVAALHIAQRPGSGDAGGPSGSGDPRDPGDPGGPGRSQGSGKPVTAED